jgi:hypothetical protein
VGSYLAGRVKIDRDVGVMGPDGPYILRSPYRWSGGISGKEIMRRLSTRERAGENIMVSTHRHMAPPEAYRGEKRVSVKSLNHAPMSHVLISFNMSNIKITCGEGKVTTNQIISHHVFDYFSFVQCQVSATR